jgi:hypothetical protein
VPQKKQKIITFIKKRNYLRILVLGKKWAKIKEDQRLTQQSKKVNCGKMVVNSGSRAG